MTGAKDNDMKSGEVHIRRRSIPVETPLTPSTYRCRICLESVSHESRQESMTTCHCKGTMAFVHRTCLEEWLTVAQTGKCEICNYQFQMIDVPPTICEYLSESSSGNRCIRRNLMFDCMCLVMVVPFLTLCIYYTSKACSVYDFTTYRLEVFSLVALSVVLSVIFLVWLVLALKYHYDSWILWRDTHHHMRLDTQTEEDKEDIQCQPHHYQQAATSLGDAAEDYSNEDLHTDETCVPADVLSGSSKTPPLLTLQQGMSSTVYCETTSPGANYDFNHSFLSPPPCTIRPRYSIPYESREYVRDEISKLPHERRTSVVFSPLLLATSSPISDKSLPRGLHISIPHNSQGDRQSIFETVV